MLVELVHNAALLVALSALYGLFARFRNDGAVPHKIIAGLLFGGLAVAAMNMPFHYSPGIIYDGRSIVLTLAGLFGGGTAAAVSVALAGAYRGYLGGPGVWAGTATILFCAMVGLAVRRLSGNRPESVGPLPLYGVGIATHVVMLLCQLLLPWPGALETIGRIWLPVTIVFPVATLFVGLLLGNEEQRIIAARKLRESEENLRITLNSIGDAVIATDRNGTITNMNPVAVELTGWDEKETAGTPLERVFRIVNEKTREAVENPVTNVMREGRIVGLANHTLLISKSGAEIPIADSGAPIKNEAGEITGVVLVFRDQTSRLRMESELRQAQKMETIGKLAGGVAHDFNNLLMIILGYVEMMLNDLDPAHCHHRMMTEVQRAAIRARDITRQLLVFSRKQILQPVALNLNDCVKNLEKMMGRLIGENIEVTTDLAENPGQVLADPGQMEQVLLNLAVNARDAMPKGGKLIFETADVEFDEGDADAAQGMAPGKYVVLSVTDTGCGMDMETTERIYDPFFTTKEFGKGTGLGLSTVYGIVVRSGGHIVCQSAPGRGTTFRIYLPRMEAGPVAQAESSPEPASEPVRPGRGERILVAEDEAAVRDLVRQMLERLEYRVTTAANGNDALALVTEKGLDPDLVITDVVMPGMGGKELIERLRAIRPGQRFLYMSGHTDNAIGDHGVLDPDTPFLQKPFGNIRVFAARIEETLRPEERNT